MEDSNLSYLVYFRPKDKAKMYETIYIANKDFWSGKTGLNLINYTTTKLNEQGFKVCDITNEMKNRVYLRSDFDEDRFFYRNILIRENGQSGFTFRIKQSYFSCKTIEDAIKLIDKEL